MPIGLISWNYLDTFLEAQINMGIIATNQRTHLDMIPRSMAWRKLYNPLTSAESVKHDQYLTGSINSY